MTGKELIEKELWSLQQERERAADKVSNKADELKEAEKVLETIKKVEQELLADKQKLEK